jgi:quinolinate synthase
VKALRKKYPDHRFIAHPECDEGIVEAADAVMSTGGMIAEAKLHNKLIIALKKAWWTTSSSFIPIRASYTSTAKQSARI